MDEKTKMTEQKQPLEDQDLEQVSGGGIYPIADKKGRRVGDHCIHHATFRYPAGYDYISYYACSKCGRPMHQGTMGMWYCDPCDRWEFSPERKTTTKMSTKEFAAWADTGC